MTQPYRTNTRYGWAIYIAVATEPVRVYEAESSSLIAAKTASSHRLRTTRDAMFAWVWSTDDLDHPLTGFPMDGRMKWFE